MLSVKRYQYLTTIMAMFAIFLLIIAPQINRFKLTLHIQESHQAHILSMRNHDHNHSLEYQQQKLNPLELAQIAMRKVAQQKAQKMREHSYHFGHHEYLCEYCVLAAHLVPMLCLVLIVLGIKIIERKFNLPDFAVISFYFVKAHPPRAGPNYFHQF